MCSATASQLPEERDGSIVQQPVAQFDHTSTSYAELLDSLKSRIQQARTKALLSVNRELTVLYWMIGRMILRSQQTEGWGTRVIDRDLYPFNAARDRFFLVLTCVAGVLSSLISGPFLMSSRFDTAIEKFVE